MNRDQFWKVLFFFVTLSFFTTTLFHKSPQPWLFGRYSLPYFVLLLFIFASTLFILFIYFWFQKKAPLIYAGIVIGACSFALLIEIVGQIYVSFRPSYNVLRYVPEKIIGWKLAPNLNFISTDEYWYAREYSVPIKINSLGFRDLERATNKPPNVSRIAILGDSFVEALHVDFSKTAGQLLEKKLNNNLFNKKSDYKHFEVLNFGTGAHGTDQALLSYLHYAKKFNPDYVFLFYFDTQMWRASSNMHCSTYGTGGECMKIRPASQISIEGSERIRNILGLEEFHQFIYKLGLLKLQKKKFPMTSQEYLRYIKLLTSKIDEKTIQKLSIAIKEEPLFINFPIDYENFISKQKQIIEDEFNGLRIKIKNRKSFVYSFISQLNINLAGIQKMDQHMKNELKTLTNVYRIQNSKRPILGNSNFISFEAAIALNLKILQHMGKKVRESGSKLILVDATKNIVRYGQLPSALGSKILEKFCKYNSIGYIPLHDQLNKSRRKGIATHWKYDWHFNETGQRIFFESMFNYFKNIKN